MYVVPYTVICVQSSHLYNYCFDKKVSFLGLSVHLGLVLENKFVHIKFPLAASIVHVPDLPKHLSFSPTLIVNTSNAPHDTHIAIWIIAIQGISIIEPDRFLKCLLRTLSPLQDLLCPVHPQEAVHLALLDKLKLGSVPQVIMCPALLQLLSGVDVLPRVLRVVCQGLLRPVGGSKDGIVLGIVEAKVIRQFSANHGLFNETSCRR